MRQLAGDKIRLVALRHRDQQVGIFGTGVAQHRGRRRVADHRAQVETILQLGETLAVVIDYRNVVLFRNQTFGNAGTDLARAKNDDFHDPPLFRF